MSFVLQFLGHLMWWYSPSQGARIVHHSVVRWLRKHYQTIVTKDGLKSSCRLTMLWAGSSLVSILERKILSWKKKYFQIKPQQLWGCLVLRRKKGWSTDYIFQELDRQVFEAVISPKILKKNWKGWLVTAAAWLYSTWLCLVTQCLRTDRTLMVAALLVIDIFRLVESRNELFVWAFKSIYLLDNWSTRKQCVVSKFGLPTHPLVEIFVQNSYFHKYFLIWSNIS